MARVDKDYDLEIHYHPRKANVVADALSRKSYCHILITESVPPELKEEIDDFQLEILPLADMRGQKRSTKGCKEYSPGHLKDYLMAKH